MNDLDYINAITKRIWESGDNIPNDVKIRITIDPNNPELAIVIIGISLEELNKMTIN